MNVIDHTKKKQLYDKSIELLKKGSISELELLIISYAAKDPLLVVGTVFGLYVMLPLRKKNYAAFINVKTYIFKQLDNKFKRIKNFKNIYKISVLENNFLNLSFKEKVYYCPHSEVYYDTDSDTWYSHEATSRISEHFAVIEQSCWLIKDIHLDNVTAIYDPVFSMTKLHKEAYAHFVAHAFPRFVKNYYQNLNGKNYKFILRNYDYKHNFVKNYIKLFNFDDNLIKVSHNKTLIELQQITFCKDLLSLEDSLFFSKKVIELMEANYKNELVKFSGLKKIYIPRYNRTLVNQDDLIAELVKLGFFIFEPSAFSILEQIAIYHAADIIIAPHGAALLNCMFCKKETQVIELANAHDAAGRRRVRLLTAATVQHFSLLEGIAADSKNTSARPDFFIDVEKIIATIRH